MQKMAIWVRCNQCTQVIEDGAEAHEFRVWVETENGTIVNMHMHCPYGHIMSMPIKTSD